MAIQPFAWIESRLCIGFGLQNLASGLEARGLSEPLDVRVVIEMQNFRL